MRRTNRWKALPVALALALVVSACGSDDDEVDSAPEDDAAEETDDADDDDAGDDVDDDAGDDEAEASGDECDTSALTIGYATKSATNQGWILINQGAEDAAADLGVGELRAVGPPIENDISGQLNVVEDFISAQVDGLAIAPVDSSGIVPVVEQANADGIPVIAIDTAIEGGEVASFVATDNLAAAVTQAETVAEAIDGVGKVVLINGSQAQQTGRDRRDGFVETMEENYPDIEVLEVQTEWDPTAAQQGLEDLIIANDDIVAVAQAWDGATVASVSLLDREGLLDDVFVIGFDGAPDAIALMLDGRVDAIVAQQLYQIGYDGMEATVAAACGEPVEERVDTGEVLLTPDTVQDFIDANPDALSEFIEEEREG
ncbi:MAG: sugar ABC transporter substrate-binding protein [Nitriliruptoraceae bacterium]|nr:sugar ABC transporter substrate-binding protein [Nitriliruptoraceae bacterium]